MESLGMHSPKSAKVKRRILKKEWVRRFYFVRWEAERGLVFKEIKASLKEEREDVEDVLLFP
ncbi:hypothetical protein HPP92_017473 [Vanilla planifolia]|uniref:Uncharacterized protein n=1 Tax=Vanilla planifolia TaxID=51239 RepID=A0A835QG28_VANPL|nr:hypothetical protein HPP92_017473 [Vanilla planifolia]